MRLAFLVSTLSSIPLIANSFLLDTRNPSRNHIQGCPIRPLVSNDFFLTLSMASQPDSDPDVRQNENDKVVITDLARYAIKGLSGDPLESVMIPRGGVQTFPDDRRFALLKETNREKFDANDPEWLHKENFLCAFSAPELMASFRSHYEIIDNTGSSEEIQRLLTLYRRHSEGNDASSEPVLGPIDLSLESGRDELASFFSNESNQPLVCVTKESDEKVSTYQFGNTRAGVKNNPGGNTRTVHIVNKATVEEFSEKTGLNLSAMRFRPNIIIDGLEPWEEFKWIGRTLRVVSHDDNDTATSSNTADPSLVVVKVLTKTVRCEGIGIDPLNPGTGKLDMPKLLSKNYPEHGPYLGVYASLEVIGGENEGAVGKLLSVGDTLELL